MGYTQNMGQTIILSGLPPIYGGLGENRATKGMAVMRNIQI
jgi:hypothetical protein